MKVKATTLKAGDRILEASLWHTVIGIGAHPYDRSARALLLVGGSYIPLWEGQTFNRVYSAPVRVPIAGAEHIAGATIEVRSAR